MGAVHIMPAAVLLFTLESDGRPSSRLGALTGNADRGATLLALTDLLTLRGHSRPWPWQKRSWLHKGA